MNYLYIVMTNFIRQGKKIQDLNDKAALTNTLCIPKYNLLKHTRVHHIKAMQNPNGTLY